MRNTGKLQGLRVLNTRPLEQGGLLSQAIFEAGGTSINFPTIKIDALPGNWLESLPNLMNVNHAIFISTNAVNYFYSTLQQHGLNWPSSINTIAIGKASFTALQKWHIPVAQTPPIANSEHILQLDTLKTVRDQTILLIKGEGGRAEIPNTLIQRGAKLVSLDVYRRILPSVDQHSIHSLWHDNLLDIILFTSQQAIYNMFTLLGEDAHAWLCRTPCLVISERIAEAAAMMGMQTIIISRYDTILSTLEHYNKGLIHDKQH